MLDGIGHQVQTHHCALCFFFFCIFFLYIQVINKSYSNEKLKGMNKLSQITDEHTKPYPMKAISQTKVFESMPDDGMKRVI